jgi:hypothetical protein
VATPWREECQVWLGIEIIQSLDTKYIAHGRVDVEGAVIRNDLPNANSAGFSEGTKTRLTLLQ